MLSDTLPDYLNSGIEIMSVGINPSPTSVAVGYPFATANNRFWPALNRSKLVSERREPSIASMFEMLNKDRIGFTDIVKKPTPRASDLTAADFEIGTRVLLSNIALCGPRVLWFQGMTVAKAFIKYSCVTSTIQASWGEMADSNMPYKIFVSPNPSGANARFSLDDLIASFDALSNA
ncbi:MAG: mismatch-specific DNA-glycosylase [Pseudomonadota bacterium]